MSRINNIVSSRIYIHNPYLQIIKILDTIGPSSSFFSFPTSSLLEVSANYFVKEKGNPDLLRTMKGKHLPANFTYPHLPFVTVQKSMVLHSVLHCTLRISSLKAQVYHMLDGY